MLMEGFCTGSPALEALMSRRSPFVTVLTPKERVASASLARQLNRIKISFSILQRKVLTPNDFFSLQGVEQRLLAFERRYAQTAQPFQWKFTKDLQERLARAQPPSSLCRLNLYVHALANTTTKLSDLPEIARQGIAVTDEGWDQSFLQHLRS